MSAARFPPQPSSLRLVYSPRPYRSSHITLCRLLLLLLLSLLAVFPCCLSAPSGELHNVWYSGLFISGIAVDESTGDVYFSDAAGNRVVRQSSNGSLLDVYEHGFYSPMQLTYDNGTLYVADSTNARVCFIDVSSGSVRWAMTAPALSSCSALALHSLSHTLYVVDGWGVVVQPFDLLSEEWGEAVSVWKLDDGPPRYLSSATILPQAAWDRGPVWLPDPLTGRMYAVLGITAYSGFNLSTIGVSAVWQFPSAGEETNYTFYVLSQPAADEAMTVTLLDSYGHYVDEWNGTGRGGAAVPFTGWAMYVDSSRNMYISDHGVNAASSPYGRVVQLAPNGTELGEWTMSDGVAYSFTSIWYDSTTASSGSCALWMTERQQGLIRIAADGTVLLPAYKPPTDPADNRTAQLSGMAFDFDVSVPDYGNSSLVLLDTSDPSTSKLWRFSLDTHTYSLINTTSAQLGPNITGVMVDPYNDAICLSDTHRRTVVCIERKGALILVLNASLYGFVEPSGLAIVPPFYESLYVADSGYNGTGAVLLLSPVNTTAPAIVVPQSTPPMYRPLSVAVDSDSNQLYVSDSNGLVFQYDVTTFPFKQIVYHQPVPAANNIVSMTASTKGTVYLLDVHTHRLIIAIGEAAWPNGSPGQDCLPNLPSLSSSSSSPHTPLSSSSTFSSSGSATHTAAGAMWTVAAIVGVSVFGLLAVVVGASCLYVRRRSTSRSGRSRRRGEWGKRLLVEKQQAEEADDEQADEEEDREEEEETEETEGQRLESDSDAYHRPDNSKSASVAVSPREGPEVSLNSGDNSMSPSRAARFDYYVARYEVAAVVSDVEEGLPSLERRRSIRPSLLLRAASLASMTSAATSTSSTSDESSASTDSPPASTAPASTSSSAAAFVSRPTTPHHIARLESVLLSVPHFIDAVSDLTIVGEGSSGVVYSGMYDGLACVVKLPKSASLTGAAWREWQCHLRLPPHRHLVRFLGALPMSSTNYLVTALVRQGSLHSLLRSSAVWYSRPYGVMRCVLDMCAALRHIHGAGIVHRDVSCRNILVDSDGVMVLADLGLAVQLQDYSPTASTVAAIAADQMTAVPVRWTSPEALSSSHYSSQSDVWSLGVAVWEMTAQGRLPYSEQQPTNSTKACIRPIIAQQLTLQVDDAWGRADSVGEAERRLADIVRRVVQLCLTYDVEQRPDSAQLQLTVERWWQEWREEAGEEAADIEREWVAYHDGVQRRLGLPVRVLEDR